MNEAPLLYYRTRDQIEIYRKMPVEQKIRKLEMEMELVNAMRQGRKSLQNLKRLSIQQLQEQILKSLKPSKIFVFGSYANGTATADSDIDLMVVMETNLPPRKRNLMVKRLFPQRSFALDAFVYTPQEFQRYKDVPGTVVYQAAHHGKLLYG